MRRRPFDTTAAQLALALGDYGSQRWRDHGVRYRPPGEVFNPRYARAEQVDVSTARAFVMRNHYSGSMPAARFCAGIFVKAPFRAEFLGGVAVFSHPMNEATLPKHLGVEDSREGTELGRLVLLDDDALSTNAESWFIARAFRLLRAAKPSIRGVLAYSDPVERRGTDGTVTKPGHLGVAYRACSASFCGRSAPRRLLVAPTGRVISERALSKLRRGEQGADYAERQLRENGAPPRGIRELGSEYVSRLITESHLTATWHPGNLAFRWLWR